MQWGVIFDWDGVIIDSSFAHEKSWERLAEEENRPLPPDHFHRGFGMKNHVVITEVLEWTNDEADIERLGDRKEELYREILKETGLGPLDGVAELLQALEKAGVPCAVGSSTPLANIEVIFENADIRKYFRAIVAGEDVSRSKPDPEGFLLAASRIEVPPERCIVFEDTTFGIEAALRSGMKAVGVATTHPADKLTAAHKVIPGMDAISVTELQDLVINGRQ